MTIIDEPFSDKECLDFINIFDSMLLTCEKMKATIKRIQGSSKKSVPSKQETKLEKTSIDCPSK